MVEMPRENPTVKNISFGIEGIFLGLFIFILVLVGLNYFRIISLSFLHPMLAILPQKQQVVENSISNNINTTSTIKNTNTKSNGVLIAEEKAEKAGFSVAWAGDTEDGSGRTILVSRDRVQDIGFPDEFGYFTHKTAVMGILKSFEKIPSSNDLYIILENPINKEQIKIRISTEGRFLDEVAAQFLVDNLQLITSDDASSVEKLFDYFGSEDGLQKIKKIVKPGDVIYAGLYAVLKADKGEIKDVDIARDRNGAIYAEAIVLRRFGGKEQIDKELAL